MFHELHPFLFLQTTIIFISLSIFCNQENHSGIYINFLLFMKEGVFAHECGMRKVIPVPQHGL